MRKDFSLNFQSCLKRCAIMMLTSLEMSTLPLTKNVQGLGTKVKHHLARIVLGWGTTTISIRYKFCSFLLKMWICQMKIPGKLLPKRCKLNMFLLRKISKFSLLHTSIFIQRCERGWILIFCARISSSHISKSLSFNSYQKVSVVELGVKVGGFPRLFYFFKFRPSRAKKRQFLVLFW